MPEERLGEWADLLRDFNAAEGSIIEKIVFGANGDDLVIVKIMIDRDSIGKIQRFKDSEMRMYPKLQ